MSVYSLDKFCEKKHFQSSFFYIAHLLDRILLGSQNDENYNELSEAIKDGQLIELHLFNEEQEIFVTKEKGHFKTYEPLLHENEQKTDRVIKRCYEIDLRFQRYKSKTGYKWLEVKEYIAYDEKSHMAYVEKTILSRLLEGC